MASIADSVLKTGQNTASTPEILSILNRAKLAGRDGDPKKLKEEFRNALLELENQTLKQAKRDTDELNKLEQQRAEAEAALEMLTGKKQSISDYLTATGRGDRQGAIDSIVPSAIADKPASALSTLMGRQNAMTSADTARLDRNERTANRIEDTRQFDLGRQDQESVLQQLQGLDLSQIDQWLLGQDVRTGTTGLYEDYHDTQDANTLEIERVRRSHELIAKWRQEGVIDQATAQRYSQMVDDKYVGSRSTATPTMKQRNLTYYKHLLDTKQMTQAEYNLARQRELNIVPKDPKSGKGPSKPQQITDASSRYPVDSANRYALDHLRLQAGTLDEQLSTLAVFADYFEGGEKPADYEPSRRRHISSLLNAEMKDVLSGGEVIKKLGEAANLTAQHIPVLYELFKKTQETGLDMGRLERTVEGVYRWTGNTTHPDIAAFQTYFEWYVEDVLRLRTGAVINEGEIVKQEQINPSIGTSTAVNEILFDTVAKYTTKRIGDIYSDYLGYAYDDKGKDGVFKYWSKQIPYDLYEPLYKLRDDLEASTTEAKRHLLIKAANAGFDNIDDYLKSLETENE